MRSLIACFIGLGLAAGCGDDNPAVKGDQGDAGSDAGNPGTTLTSFVIDLVKNHSNDPTPATFASFKDLPDPDATNAHAYDPLFP